MDRQNLRTVDRWPGCRPDKVVMARSFDREANGEEVPDPYYGEVEDFEQVADMLETACAGIIDRLR
jgi:protein-tyrosine phosphatase